MPVRRRSGTRRPASRGPSRKGLSVKTYTGLNQKRMASKSGGARVIIPQGKTNSVQFFTNPDGFREFDQHQWREGRWWYVPCAGEDCPLCADEDNDKRKLHYKFVACVWDFKEKRVAVLEGPKTLATQIFYKYRRGKARFLKSAYDVTKFPTEPVTYGFELSEKAPKNLSGLKQIDLDKYIQDALDAYYGDLSSEGSSKKSKKSALDDEDFEDEDEFEDDDDIDDEEFEDDDEEDEEDDDEEGEEPDEDEMMDRDAYSWSELKEYAEELGVKVTTKNRAELVRKIVRKRDR